MTSGDNGFIDDDGSFNVNYDNASTHLCVRDERKYHLVVLVSNGAFLVFHLFTFIAVLLHVKSVVRGNLSNIYAGNVLLANVVACSVNLYLESMKYTDSYPTHEWFIFVKALAVLLNLVLCGSIGLVVNAMRESMFRIHRSVAGITRKISQDAELSSGYKVNWKTKIHRWVLHNPRKRAAILISAVWVVPLSLTVLAVFMNDCFKGKCSCMFDQVRADEGRNCKFSEGCSNFWPPMTNFTIILGTSLWLLYLAILVIALMKSYTDFRKMASSQSTMNRHNQANSINMTFYNHQSSNFDDLSMSKSRNNTPHSTPTKGTCAHVWFLASVRGNLRILASLSAAYLLGTLPFVMVAFLHSTTESINFIETEDLRLIPIYIIQLTSQGLCTLILCVRIPTIKDSCRLLIYKLSCKLM